MYKSCLLGIVRNKSTLLPGSLLKVWRVRVGSFCTCLRFPRAGLYFNFTIMDAIIVLLYFNPLSLWRVSHTGTLLIYVEQLFIQTYEEKKRKTRNDKKKQKNEHLIELSLSFTSHRMWVHTKNYVLISQSLEQCCKINVSYVFIITRLTC